MRTLNKPEKVQERLSKYDKNIIYVGGYENKKSVITIKCKRCETIRKVKWSTFIMKYSNKTDYDFCNNCRNKKIKDTLIDREQHFIEKLNNIYPTFEYISGYVDSKNPVILKCKICGYEFTRVVDSIRAGRNLVCFNCNKIKVKQQRYIKEYIKELITEYEKEKKKELKETNRFIKFLKRNTLYIKYCKCCNAEILTNNNKKKLCDRCRTKLDKHHSHKSLQKLYKRDNGICYICGKECDYKDYIVKDNQIICGDYYPSIDHVIPIAQGGTDDWNNIRLAHRICNSLKRDYMV